jgi:hypothetical protein
MTNEHQASRTIVKSPPELWAECSDAGSLARHIGEFGEIRITRLEPETTVAWEGEHASGTVEIEPSGWGTKVTLTAETSVGEVAEEPTAVVAEPTAIGHVPANNGTESVEEVDDAKVEETSPEPDPAVATDPAPARGWRRVIARTRTLFRARTTAVPPAVVPPADGVSTQTGGSGYRTSVLEANASPEPWGIPPPADAEAEPPWNPAESPSAEADTDKAETVEPGAEEASAPIDPAAVLVAALDSLGQAHHRPFSRA